MENGNDINNDGGKVFPNGGDEKGKAVQALERIYGEVQELLERNRMIIREIGEIHEAHEIGGLNRDTTLLREFNINTAHIMEIYSDISSSFYLSLAKGSPAVDDTTKGGQEGLHPPQ
ncbi:protein ELF4-LIKE 3-like [Lolium perenne]|uniref:protein ELF4-LIKE 3-like n=1 Tax=Lolium perenne TaxID=4522 RepID=UPI0021F60D15|nr:uncharacterized protein LOC127303357 [Lolium perenne]